MKVKHIILIYIIFLTGQTNIYPQTRTIKESSANIKISIQKLTGELAYAISSPYRTTIKYPFKTLTYAGLVTGLVLYADSNLDEEYGIESGPDAFRKVSPKLGRFYDSVGPKKFIYGITGSLFAGGLLLRNNKLTETATLMLKSHIINHFITGISKASFGRSRPYANKGPKHFKPFQFRPKPAERSMPSGHTSGIFSIMTVIAKQYDNVWIDIFCYSFAASVGIQRMESRNHWASDVLVGGTLGYLVGSSLSEKKNKPISLSVQPFILANQVGLSIHF